MCAHERGIYVVNVMIGELISTSRALSSRCSWVLSFLDGEQNETGHKPQSGGKLCDFFEKLVLFGCIMAMLAGCGLGFMEETFETEVNFTLSSFWGDYLLQGFVQEFFFAFMGLLNFINVVWWSITCTSTSALGFGDSLHHKLCGGAHGALHRQFRGGVGGSSASSGSQSMQDVMQQLSLVVAKLEAGDRPQDEVSRFVAQLATLVSKWQLVTPTRNELKQELQNIMEEVGKSPWSQYTAGARQSFYEQFGGRALQSQVGKEEPKENKAFTKGKGKSKAATRGKGPPDLPRFDLKRIAPSRAIISWQAVAGALENGDHPPNASIAICDSTARILELQELAAVHEVKASLILVARISKEEEGKQFSDGGKSELLPFQGNIAFVQARIATLDKSIPDLSGPVTIEATAPKEHSNISDWITFRITSPLVILDKKDKDRLLHHPEFALRLLGCECAEVRTSGWQSQHGCVTGYACIPRDKAAEFLAMSGSGGIFIQNLKKDVVSYPSVVWEAPLPDESEVQYFQRVQKAGKDQKVPLAFRQGGGSWLGLVKKSDSSMPHSWSIFGIPWSWGPRSVQQLLVENGWELVGLPKPPVQARKPCGFQGKQSKSMDETFTYKVLFGNEEKIINIRRWIKHRKLEGTVAKLTGARWWSPDMADPDPISSTLDGPSSAVSPTVLDSPMDGGKEAHDKEKEARPLEGSGVSPEKKRIRKDEPKGVVASEEIVIKGGMRGPAPATSLYDCGGNGDCGWRVLAFLIALTNGKWKMAPSTIADKLDTISKSLHSKTVTWLLHTDTSWVNSWAVDPSATIRSEGGPVPESVEAFKECLRRPKRFIDGLCLQAVALMQKVSIVVFKPLPQGQWERIAVFQGPGSVHSMPILPVVLHAEHYYAVVKTAVKSHFPLEWVTQGGILVAQSLVDIDSHTYGWTHAGGFSPKSSAGSSTDSVEKLLRTCNSERSVDSITKLLQTCKSEKGDNLRTCTPLKNIPGEAFSQPESLAKQLKAKGTATWCCPICKDHLQVAAGQSLKVVAHVRRRHPLQYQEAMQKFSKLGRGKSRGVSGFGIRGILAPVSFHHIKKEDIPTAAFICPYCSKGFQMPLSKHLAVVSKKHHLAHECSKKPCGKIGLKRFAADHLHSEHGQMLQAERMVNRSMHYTLRSQQRAKKRGHDAIFLDVKSDKYSNCKGKQWQGKLHICRTCLAHNGGHKGGTGGDSWRKVCRGHPTLKAGLVSSQQEVVEVHCGAQ